MSLPDLGRSAAQRLHAAVAAGGTEALPLTEEAALRLAAACDVLVADLETARAGGRRLAAARGTAGFPDLPTGHALAAGFTGKGVEYLDTITALQDTALRFKAAYLAIAGRPAEAEAAIRAADTVARSGRDRND